LILSSTEIKKRLLTSEDNKDLWKNKEWDKIRDKILITDFVNDNLELNTYTLRVGNQYIKLKNPDEVIESDKVVIDPGETVFILTKEYIALPKSVTGLVVPKARWIFEGLVTNATRVDPTWYGRLQIAVTNVSKDVITIPEGEGLWSIYFIESYEVDGELDTVRSPSLGREKLSPLRTTYHRPQRLLLPEQVTLDVLNEIVETYGKPWDVVRGVIKIAKDEVVEYVDYEKAPNILEEAKKEAYEKAFNTMMTWLKLLIGSIIALIVAGIVRMFFF
jgi:deoxycytidine triphosphate deaminase